MVQNSSGTFGQFGFDHSCPGRDTTIAMENRTGSNAAETRCGSEEARRYIWIKVTDSWSRSWNGGWSTSSAAESPPGDIAA